VLRAQVSWVWRLVAGWRHDDGYHRNIYFLSTARMISTVGTMVSYVALVAVVYERSGHSGRWVAAVLVVMFGVTAAVGPWAGALGDRLDRRLLMIGSDLAAAATFVGIAFAHSLPLLVVFAALSALAESPFASSSQALLVMLVPEDRRTWATATRASSYSAGQLLGGALGGFLVAAFGGATAFLLNAASFVISAALITRIKGTYRATPSNDASDRRVSAGFRLVFSTPALRLTLLATSVGLLGTGMINVAEYPLFVNMGGGSEAYGAAVSGWALGAFIAGRVIRKQGDAYSERRRLLFGCALVAIAIGLCGVVPIVGAVVVLFSIGGFAASTRGIASTLIFQRWAPDHLRARTFAAMGTANLSAIGVAMIISGIVLASLTPAGVCIASGLLGLCALLIATRVPPRRRDPLDLDGAVTETLRHPRGEWSLAT
jgi:MFS family permease